MTGEWEVNIETNYDDLPDKIKDAFTNIDASSMGTYEFIAYLGSKTVNDVTHHAILTKYFLINNIQNVKNVVLMMYAEDSEGKWTSVNDTLLLDGSYESGIKVVICDDDVEDDAIALFDETFGEIADVTRTAIAVLATQSVDEATKYYYATEEASVADNDSPKSVTIVSILDTDKSYEEIVKVI